VVPLVFIKNTNYPVVNSITNLTQRQAVTLETSTNPATYFGGTNTNHSISSAATARPPSARKLTSTFTTPRTSKHSPTTPRGCPFKTRAPIRD
jgi:hypothetical protein